MYTVSFEVLLAFALLALASGVVACVIHYAKLFGTPRPSVFRYFGLAVVVAVASYLIGSFTGIAVMCSPSAGNLCGIWGALVWGPLLGGLSLWLYGPVYRRRTAHAP